MIKIHLDIAPYEAQWIEERAKEWRVEEIRGFCESYGFPAASVHAEGIEMADLSGYVSDGHSTAWESFGGLYWELENLAEKWNAGIYNESLQASFAPARGEPQWERMCE